MPVKKSTCKYTLKKGSRAGEKCGENCRGKYCKEHNINKMEYKKQYNTIRNEITKNQRREAKEIKTQKTNVIQKKKPISREIERREIKNQKSNVIQKKKPISREIEKEKLKLEKIREIKELQKIRVKQTQEINELRKAQEKERQHRQEKMKLERREKFKLKRQQLKEKRRKDSSVFYIISTEAKFNAQEFKVGYHNGSILSLRQRYMTAIPEHIIYYFQIIKKAARLESKVLKFFDEERKLHYNGAQSEWINMNYETLYDFIRRTRETVNGIVIDVKNNIDLSKHYTFDNEKKKHVYKDEEKADASEETNTSQETNTSEETEESNDSDEIEESNDSDETEESNNSDETEEYNDSDETE